MDIGEPQTLRLQRIPRRVRKAFDFHAPRVGLRDAREDVHESALARAIFPDERERLAGSHFEVDTLERHRGAKALPNSDQVENRRALAREDR